MNEESQSGTPDVVEANPAPPSVTIVPTVGRIVLYCLSVADADAINHSYGFHGIQGNKVYAGEVYPAIVVKVWSPDLININVFTDGPLNYWATSRHVSDGPKEGYFHWMDYQKAQAAKTPA